MAMSTILPAPSQRPDVTVVPRRPAALVFLPALVRIRARQPLAHLARRVWVPPVRVERVEIPARLVRELLARAFVYALLCILYFAPQGTAVERLVY